MPRLNLKPRKAPRQQRSLAMVDLLLAAAARVLSRESLEGFNSNRVAAVAGVSVGSLYQYFPNKAALVVALIDREHECLVQALEALVAAQDGCSLDETLQAVARLAIEQQYGDPIYAAALDHEERRLPLGARTRSAETRLGAAAQAIIERHRSELAPGLPEAAARDMLLITRALVEADSQTKTRPPADLQVRIVWALRGYLLSR